MRWVILGHGVLAYALFCVAILYQVGFVAGWFVPKDIDAGALVPLGKALTVDLALLAVFGLQHSLMARRAFKRWLTKRVPEAAERSTYVLATSALFLLLYWQWKPIPRVLWSVGGVGGSLLTGLYGSMWAIVLRASFAIDHFELFGLRQAWDHFRGRGLAAPRFQTPLLYRVVRHPIVTATLIAYFAAPTMTLGRLVFAITMTAYALVGLTLEERELVRLFGEEYRSYQGRVPMLLPWPRPQRR